MKTLFVCRHGQSQWNRQGYLQGQLDSPLTALGETQMQQLAGAARQWNIGKVYSSDLGRAIHSARICAKALQVEHQIIDGLRERHFGNWQGRDIRQLPEYQTFRQYCYQDADLIPAQTGESSKQLLHRYQRALLSVAQRNENGNVLVIAHGDALNCLLGQWQPIVDLQNAQGLKLQYANHALVWDDFID